MHLSRRSLIIAGMGVVALLLAGYVLLGHAPAFAKYFHPSASPLQSYADRIVKLCAKESYHPSCYDREIPKLMDEGLTMEQSFAVTSLIQDTDKSYYFCHVLGHNLSAKETAKDPSKWTTVIARCPTGQCSNGCLHGAAQERFRSESLTPTQVQAVLPQLADICEGGSGRSYTGLERASCYHSLGHLAMYITAANITTATAACDKIAKKNGEDYTQTCYEGAYMQIFQPLEPEDFGLVKDIAPTTTVAAETFCDSFSGDRRGACHRESWPLYRAHLTDPSALTRFCTLTPGDLNVTRCFNAMFYVLTAQFNFDTNKITTLCKGLPKTREGQCFANAASRAIETDYRLAPTSVALCKTAQDEGVGDRCYGELLFYAGFNFHSGSKEVAAFCNALPEPWQGKCSRGEGRTMPPSQPMVRDDI